MKNWVMLSMPHTSCSKCNMKLIQQPGKEKLLISKQKTLKLSILFVLRFSSLKIAQIF